MNWARLAVFVAVWGLLLGVVGGLIDAVYLATRPTPVTVGEAAILGIYVAVALWSWSVLARRP